MGHAGETVAEISRQYDNLRQVRVDLPAGEPAYWTIPRASSPDDWRMAGGWAHDEPLTRPMRRDVEEYLRSTGHIIFEGIDVANNYFSILPQPIVMHQAMSRMFEQTASQLFRHYAEEPTLARQHDVPMLVGRFDAIGDQQGRIQICELDDVCALWSRLELANPIAGTFLHGMEDQLGMPIFSAELFAPGHPWRDGRITYRCNLDTLSYADPVIDSSYATDDAWWRGDYNDFLCVQRQYETYGRRLSLDEVALIVRARRKAPGFAQHMDKYGSRSITMGWERDDKWPLVAERLGALAANADVALEFAQDFFKSRRGEHLALKGRHGARTETTAILTGKGEKRRGESSLSQALAKLVRADARHEQIILQPYKEPDTLAQAGVVFHPTDQQYIREYYASDQSGWEPAKHVVPGHESRFSMIFRTYVVYLTQERRLVHIGGWWQGTTGLLVHGGAHSVAGPLYVDGLAPYPGKESDDTRAAQAMLRTHRPF